jgi:hypothetical protein
LAEFALSCATLLFVLRDASFIGCTLAHEHGLAVDLSTIPQVRSGRNRTPIRQFCRPASRGSRVAVAESAACADGVLHDNLLAQNLAAH